MDVRRPFFQNIALILAGVLFLNPIVATAAQLAVDSAAGGNTSLGQAGNGVPIVNIATPNGSGLSHNKFSDYNVGQQGLILNNATERLQGTQQGGIILGNPNLSGRAAGVILNEVTGSNRSQLQGYTEVAGQAAHVIVANPHGISCDGCGFLNTPRATLSTGTPVIDNGQLRSFDVNGGDIAIEGAGLNASNLDQFDLITRSAKLNAELHAQRLNVITGRNEVDAATLQATAKAADGSEAPLLAIDSSALGGMYAGAIRLVGTEAGVGVKLAGDLAASAGDIQIEANGQLTVANAAASGQIAVLAGQVETQGQVYAGTRLDVQAQGNLVNRGSLAARDRLALSSGATLENRGHVEAGVNADNSRNGTGTVELVGQQVRNAGSVVASRDVHVEAKGELDNSGGHIASQGDLAAEVGQLTQVAGELLAEGDLRLTGQRLDNRKGVVAANGQLALTADAIDNRGGEISSRGTVSLTATSLDNSDSGRLLAAHLNLAAVRLLNRDQGLIFGRDQVHLSGAHLNNAGGTLASDTRVLIELTARAGDPARDGQLINSEGKLSSEGTLSVSAAGVDNSGGNLSSAGAMQITSQGALLNQQGRLLTDAGLVLRSAGLDNRHGQISAVEHLSVTTGRFDNDSGRLTGSATLDLQTGQISNAQGRIATSGPLSVQASGLAQQGGELFSQSRLTLDLNGGDLNNDAGLLHAPDRLLLNNLGAVSNRQGEISSSQGFSLAATSLDNAQGRLLSERNLTLRIQGVLDNLAGLISAKGVDLRAKGLVNEAGTLFARDDLAIDVTGTLSNASKGLIQSAGDLRLASGMLSNAGGTLLAGQALDLRSAGAVDNRNGGLINSQGTLTVDAASLDSSQGGEVSAKGDLRLSLDRLTQQQGALIGESALTLDLRQGELDNQQGLITSNGPLTLSNLRALDNRGGEVSSLGVLALAAASLNNQNGHLISREWLRLSLGHSDNQGGLLSGWQGLQLIGTTLDNRQLGTLSSRDGDLDVQLTGALLNSGEGALVAAGRLDVDADSLDNSDRGILSSGAGQHLLIAQDLDNRGGQIDASGNLVIDTGSLSNAGGSLLARQDLTLSSGGLDNAGGRISASGAATLNVDGTLVNTAGQLASGGPLRIDAKTLNNQGGTLASQSTGHFAVTQLNNSDSGTLAANGALHLDVAGAAHNRADGLIYSRDANLHLNAASLDNSGGAIQGQGDLLLNIGAALNNQSGTLQSRTGAVELTAASLDNRQGTLASLEDWVRIRLSGWLRNGASEQGGLIQGQHLDLLVAGNLDNTAGRIHALGGAATLQAGAFDNQNGTLYAQGDLLLRGGDLNNRSGKIGAANIALEHDSSAVLNNQQGIVESRGALRLQGASLNNQGGQLRALGTSGTTFFTLGGLLDNRSGLLETANRDLTLNLGSLLNQNGKLLHAGSGEFGVALAQVARAGGSFVTQGSLTLKADSWSNDSILQAGHLTLDIGTFEQTANGQLLATGSLTGKGGNWINHGLIASDGPLSLTLSGGYSGNGRVTSQGDLDVKAARLSLSDTASITAGGAATFALGGALLNQGRLTSAENLTLSATSLNNQGTLGSAGRLILTTPSLVNENGLLFSGDDMALYVDTFINRYADVYSLGNIFLARNASGAMASRLDNLSATLEAVGDTTLRVGILDNARDRLLIESGIYSARIDERFCVQPGIDCSGKRSSWFEITQRDRLQVTEASAMSQIVAGGDLRIYGDVLNNNSSLISAGGDFSADLRRLDNSGVEEGEIQTTRMFRLVRMDGKYIVRHQNNAQAFTQQYWHESAGYDQQRTGEIAGAINRIISDGDFEQELHSYGSRTILSSGDQRYAGIIQAAGNVAINAQQNVGNGVTRPGSTHVISGNRSGSTSAGAADSFIPITLNSQLPPDLAQQQINPLTLPGFSLPSGQNGLFRLSDQAGSDSQVGESASGQQWALAGTTLDQAQRDSANGMQIDGVFVGHLGQAPGAVPIATNQPHKYLIETNPALTELNRFLSSDYMLDLLGYDPDQAQKRLGDGLYEQRLIREAIVARTGQRFIAGLDSDEAMFRYLMNNAIASKEALNLGLGVSLSAEQVAALTHDIVWMEEQEVLGEKVLVPVLYLAQAEGRLAPNGALIQGRDVALISGGDLSNQGTLRASGELDVQAVNIANSGLLQASERLQLLAEDSIRNAQGGIIAGRDVSLVAGNDIVNERTANLQQSSLGDRAWATSFVDSAARIEASDSLSLAAGRDVSNLGSVLDSRGDLTIEAGRDLTIASVQDVQHQSRGSNFLNERVTQLGAEVSAGRDLQVSAGRDLGVVASQVTAGRDLDLGAGRDLVLSSAADESHTYFKSKKVTSINDRVTQQSSEIQAGGNTTLVAGESITVVASKVGAGADIVLSAGEDINLDAAQNEQYSYFYKKKKGGLFSSSKERMSESQSSEAVLSTLSAGNDLVVLAQNDIAARGARLISDQDIYLSAGNDVVLAAAENSQSSAQAKSKSRLFSSKASSQSSGSTTVVGTELEGRNVTVQADNDIFMHAAGLRADNAISLEAGRDIDVGTAQQDQYSSQASKSSSLKWHIFDSLATNGSLTLEQKAKAAQSTSSLEVGSTLSGATIDMVSGRDTAIRGSTLVADQDIRVDAGRNLFITSGESKDDSSAKSSSKKSGEIGNWWQGATGVVSLKQSSENSTTQQLGSQIASLGGDVELTAGEAYRQQASQVIAPQGDVAITAKRVDIEAGYDLLSASQKQSSNRTAVGGTVSSPLIDAVQGAQRMINAAGDTQDSRLTALAAVNTAMSGYQAYEGAQTLASGDLTGFKISVNLSNSKSQSSGSQSGQNVVASSIAAGGDITINATGDGDNSNLNIVGSTLDAGRNVSLNADGSVNLSATQNTANLQGKDSNSGWSAGVGFGVGQQNGFTLELAANKGKGMSEGEAVTYTNTLVNAGEKVTLNSGGDTNLRGAIVTAKQVTAEVGGDLNLASLQDIDNYKSKQQSAGVGLSLCIPPFCAGVSTVSGSFSQQKIDSEYASVGQQTGIKAGDGGFQINVAGNTDLKGAVIASNDKAVEDDKNRLTSATLTHSDIENKAEYKGNSISLSGSYSGAAHDKQGQVINGTDGKPLHEAGVTAGTPIALSASGNDSSTTHSGISAGAITITNEAKQQELTGQTAEEAVAGVNRDVSSDKDGSNTLKPIFDRKEVEAGFEITEQFVRNVGTFLEQRSQESTQAKRDLEAELAKPVEQRDNARIEQLAGTVESNATWEVGGLGRTLVSAISGAAGGNVMGGGGQLLQGAAVNYLQGLATEQVKAIADHLDSETARTALHGIVGCVGAAAQSQSCGGGALGGSASVVLNNLLDTLSDQTASGMTDEQKQNRLNLIGTLVAGITAAAGGEVAVAANAAQIETEHNFLGPASAERLAEAREQLKNKTYSVESLRELISMDQSDQRSDALLSKYIADKDSLSEDEAARLGGYLQLYYYEMASKHGEQSADQAVASLLSGNPAWLGYQFPYAGTSEQKDAAALALGYGFFNTRAKSENEQLYTDATKLLQIHNETQGLANLGDPAIYFLSGAVGSGVRATAATNGALQLTYAGTQAADGDGWNAAGNAVVGLLGIASLKAPTVVTSLDGALVGGNLDTALAVPAWLRYGAALDGNGAKSAGEVASIGGKTCVYNCVVDGVTRYVGITDDIVKRGQAHLREKGIVVSKIRGLDNISRADARAVEQTLIDYHGLGKDGGTLINKINSISSVKNPTKYEQGLIRGAELLKKAGYEGF
ncbi:hemagglutinin repeat-containing protein [Phytopseudomonas dryadis]|nr:MULTISPECIES: hemagglutinin repeat-containing protein [Pseudomonas]